MKRDEWEVISQEIVREISTKKMWEGIIDGDKIKIIDNIDNVDHYALLEVELFINDEKRYEDNEYLDIFYLIADVLEELESIYVEQ